MYLATYLDRAYLVVAVFLNMNPAITQVFRGKFKYFPKVWSARRTKNSDACSGKVEKTFWKAVFIWSGLHHRLL